MLKFTLLQWNCCGYFQHIENIKQLISEYQPNVLCLQETNFKPDYSPTLRHYDVYNTNRETGKKASGGAAIFVAKEVHSVEVNLTTNLEAVAITIWVPTPITICNVYLPASHNLVSQELINLISQLPSPFILTGDFNAHNQLWGSKSTKPRGKLIENVLLTTNLNLLNTGEPTHFNATSGTFSHIDLSFCSPALSTSLEWRVADALYDSDHFPIMIDFINSNQQHESTFNRWTLKKADWTAFSEFINRKMGNYEVTHDVNMSVQLFNNIIKEAADKHVGKKIGRKGKKCVPWWNNQCADATKKSKAALNKLKKHNTPENLIEFKKLKAEARRTIKKSKRESWANYVSSLTTSTPYSQVWDKIKKIKGINTIPRITTLRDNHGTASSRNEDVANILAKTFKSFSSSASASKSDTFIPPRSQLQNRLSEDDNRELNKPIIMTELEHAVKVSGDSAAGPDEIPMVFLKKLPESAFSKLLNLYNTIWLSGKFPDLWKTAIIFPIHKPGKSKIEATSYRPISLTCTLCKLLEKVINKRLMWFLEKRELLVKEQNGFRPNRSTLDNIVQFQTEILDTFANKQDLVAVFFDFQHAFDTTRPDTIIDKLTQNGISGCTYRFIRNFLSDRTFKVRINGTESDQYHLDCGVPQGSVLSTTLFLIAINSVISGVKLPVHASLFADDLLLYCRGKNIHTIHTLIQHAVTDVANVSRNLGFKLSTSKSNTMVFSRRLNRTALPPIKLFDSILMEVHEKMFLGMLFDRQLTWRPHIKHLKADCVRRLNIIKTLAHQNWGAQEAIILRVYRSLIRSKIDYGSVAYASASKSVLKLLNPIHSTALRLATGALRTSPVASLERETNEPPLWIRRQHLIAKYAAKIAEDPSKSVYSCVFNGKYETLYSAAPRLPVPLSQKIRDVLPLDANRIKGQMKFGTPPWSLKLPVIDTTLSQYMKSETPQELLRKSHLELLSNFSHDTVFFTDGSKSTNQTSSAVICEDTMAKFKFRLAPMCSVFSAELFAILKALELILNSSNRNSIICSDSKSAIDAVSDIFSKNTLVQEIHRIHMQVVDANKSVCIIWTPSHCGILGNEAADKLAKESVDELDEEPLITHSDVINYLKNSIRVIWQQHWDLQTDKLKRIEPSVSYTPLPNMRRRDEVVIRRMRIGHTLLTHKHVFDNKEPPVCDPCYGTPLTVEHLLTDCIRYNLDRYEAELNFNFKETLDLSATNTHRLIIFLRMSNLYSLL